MKERCIVRPAEPTPETCLPVSNVDALFPHINYVPICYFYASKTTANESFRSTVLKAALGRALVQFYPVAGRVKTDHNDRIIEIHCNGDGVLFVEAEADSVMDDLGDFNITNLDLGFTPVVDSSQGASACPLFMVQVTRFKCGGVCVGVALEHILADGTSWLRFINAWSDIARGHNYVKIPLFLDRRAMSSSPNDPPRPKFTHIEYEAPPEMKSYEHDDAASGKLIYKKLKLSRNQMNALKAKCKDGDGHVRYTTFEVLVGHVWRCSIMTWRLPKDQETKLRIPVSGRTRLQEAPLPQGYFGNCIFYATSIVKAGELCSNPIKFSVNKVHEAIARMDNEYLRSAINFLNQQRDLSIVSSNLSNLKCPNLEIINWARLPYFEADFGWGRPVYVGRGDVPPVGRSHLLPTDDGSILYGVTFPERQMELFEKLFYGFWYASRI